MSHVSFRAVLGVSVTLLMLHGLAATGTLTVEHSAVASERARLRIDPNVATREELMLLPRIGPVIADYIIEYRDSVRPATAFHGAEDLARVHRIGPRTVEGLWPLLRFPPPDGAETGVEDVAP